jgi:hypothetical protein
MGDILRGHPAQAPEAQILAVGIAGNPFAVAWRGSGCLSRVGASVTTLDMLRAIQDAQNQSQWARARSLVYTAIVQEQKRIADAQNNDPRKRLRGSQRP